MSNQSNKTLTYVDADLADMAPQYLTGRISELEQVPVFVEKKDFSAIRFMGHKMKGNAALFGLDWLAEQGSLLEKLAEKEESEKIISLAQEMVQALSLVEFIPLG